MNFGASQPRENQPRHFEGESGLKCEQYDSK